MINILLMDQMIWYRQRLYDTSIKDFSKVHLIITESNNLWYIHH